MHIEFPPAEVVVPGLDQVQIPPMLTIRQRYDRQKIEDIPAHVRMRLQALPRAVDYAGKRVCVTAGSRGIPHMPVLYRAVCDVLKGWGAKPFIIPAMGSHGGGDAAGQLEILNGYGITEDAVGAPVISSMEVVQYDTLPDGTPLYCDRLAWQSDGIVLLHKVKPHTDFRADHESGLAKMIAIGVSKHKGAAAFHQLGFEQFAAKIPEAAERFLLRAPVAFGIGVVQNAYDELCAIEAAPPERIMELDARLLKLAKERMARFKFRELDLLVVDQIGKNISGFGLDPNVVGRTNGLEEDFAGILKLQKLFIRGLTPESHGNGSGISMADLTTRECLNSIEWTATWTNLIASTRIKGGKIPMYLNTDLDAMRLALLTCTGPPTAGLKVARIRSTLELDEIEVSPALYERLKAREDVELVRGPYELAFDRWGRMAPLGGDTGRSL